MKNLFLLLFSFSVLTGCKCNKSTAQAQIASLEGNWELSYISGPRIAFEGLYPNDKPTLKFDLKENKVSGKNSCNNFSGSVKIEGNKINFDQQGMISTKMFCPGEGESIYMSTLGKINSYSISPNGNELTLIMGDIAMMRFNRN